MGIRKYDITEHEWSLLDRLAEEAKMDWFFRCTTIKERTEKAGRGNTVTKVYYKPKGYLTKEQMESSSCAFLAENFFKFTKKELKEIRAFYIRCGIPAADLDYEIERFPEVLAAEEKRCAEIEKRDAAFMKSQKKKK